jgi:hypothetical protein
MSGFGWKGVELGSGGSPPFGWHINPPNLGFLILGWDDISNANLLVGDASNVADWNTFFDLPTNGRPFASVQITGNDVNLIGGSDIHLRDNIFRDNSNLISVISFANCIITAGAYCFSECYAVSLFDLPALEVAGAYCFVYCSAVTSFDLPALQTVGQYCFAFCGSATSFNLPLLKNASVRSFQGCESATSFDFPLLETLGEFGFAFCGSATSFNFPLLRGMASNAFRGASSSTSFNLPSCTNLGGSVGNNFVFQNIFGNTITLTVPSALMTCNGGNPDGDIQRLQANNTVTIITV